MRHPARVRQHQRERSRIFSYFPLCPVAAGILAAIVLLTCPSSPFVAQSVAAEQILTIQELKKRSDELDRREQALNSLEADLNARTAKLKELETMLQKMLDEAKSVRDARMTKLIDVYSNMNPTQAAGVMQTIDVKLAAKVLAGMRSRQSGDILNKMATKKAAAISEELIKLQAGPDLPKKP